MLVFAPFFFTPDSLDSRKPLVNPFSKESECNKLLKKINGEKISKILKENLKYIFKFQILQYYNEKERTEKEEISRIRQEINIFLGDELKFFKLLMIH